MYNTGLIPVRVPIENCVDGSDEAVSVYAAADGAIKATYTLEAQLNKEFENAKSRIIASSDLMDFSEDGKKALNDDLFVGVDEDPSSVGITVFNPAIREQSYLTRKNDYLRNIENIIGFKRGILSEVEADERTATEITSSAGDYNLTIIDLQEMWTDAVHEAIATCDVLGQEYLNWSTEKAEPPVIDYGNGVLYDPDKEFERKALLVAQGHLLPEIIVGLEMNMPTETDNDLAEIRKLMPDHMNGTDPNDKYIE